MYLSRRKYGTKGLHAVIFTLSDIIRADHTINTRVSTSIIGCEKGAAHINRSKGGHRYARPDRVKLTRWCQMVVQMSYHQGKLEKRKEPESKYQNNSGRGE